ncbi:uncharacterized [Tachysurus ichikawai]
MYIQRAKGASEGIGLEFKVQLWTVQPGSASVQASGSTPKTVFWPRSANIMATVVQAAHLLTFPVQHFNIHVWYSLYLRKEGAGGTARDEKGDIRIWKT